MSGLPILDLVAGLVFIFFLLSVIVSSAVEVVLTLLRVRAGMLARWLRTVFSNTALRPDGQANAGVSLGQAIMDHCMTTVLSGANRSTTYIKSSDFVNAFLDQITRLPVTNPATNTYQTPPATLPAIVANIAQTTVISGELKRTVLALAQESEAAYAASQTAQAAVASVKSDIELFKQKLANWYDSNTERLVSRLKTTWAMPLTGALALLVAVGLNADTFEISRYLYDNKEAAKTLADKATVTIGRYQERVDGMREVGAASGPADVAQLQKSITALQDDIKTLEGQLPADFPIGWKDNAVVMNEFGRHWPGWIATVLAILVGAPFWFDLLNKIANIRGAGPKPASTIGDTKGNTTINP